MGFRQSEIDTCVFYKKHDDGSETFVALYVDDMLVVGSDANIELLFSAENDAINVRGGAHETGYSVRCRCAGVEV